MVLPGIGPCPGHVCSSLIHKSRRGWQPICPSVDGWSKNWVYPYHEISLNNKKEQSFVAYSNLDESPENYSEGKKPIQKDYILYGSIYRTFLQWRYSNEDWISGAGGKRWEGGVVRREKELGVVWTGQHKGSSWWWKCSVSWLYQFSVWVVILLYPSFARCYHWKKLNKNALLFSH